MPQYTDIVIKPNPNTQGNQGYNSNYYRGLSTVNRQSRTFQLYDIELIKQDLVNHFNIRKGEKLYQPEYGTIIWDAIFEPFTDTLKQRVLDDVHIV